MHVRPRDDEYNEFYHRYVSGVSDGDIADTLEAQFEETCALLEAVPAEREDFRYAPGKWSIREVVGHLIDTEAMFAGRILWLSREPETELPGMDQDRWVETSRVADRPLAELIEDLRVVRSRTVRLVRSLTPQAWDNRGRASGHGVSVRALPWIIAGHERAHQEGLRRDYGV